MYAQRIIDACFGIQFNSAYLKYEVCDVLLCYSTIIVQGMQWTP